MPSARQHYRSTTADITSSDSRDQRRTPLYSWTNSARDRNDPQVLHLNSIYSKKFSEIHKRVKRRVSQEWLHGGHGSESGRCRPLEADNIAIDSQQFLGIFYDKRELI